MKFGNKKSEQNEPNLHSAVHGSGKQAPSRDCQRGDAALMAQQSLSANHVVHTPHLDS